MASTIEAAEILESKIDKLKDSLQAQMAIHAAYIKIGHTALAVRADENIKDLTCIIEQNEATAEHIRETAK